MTNTVKDPVCGMSIDPAKAAATTTFQGETYHFCSAMCKTKFSMNPAKFAGAKDEAHDHNHSHHNHSH